MGRLGFLLALGLISAFAFADIKDEKKQDCRALVVAQPVKAWVTQFYKHRDTEVRQAMEIWREARNHWEKIAGEKKKNSYETSYQQEARELAAKYSDFIKHAEGQYDKAYIQWKVAQAQVGSVGTLFVDAVRMGNPHQDWELLRFDTSQGCNIYLDELLKRRFGDVVNEIPNQKKPTLNEREREIAMIYLSGILGKAPHPDTLERLRSRPMVRPGGDSELLGRMDYYREMAWGNSLINWKDGNQLKALGEWIDILESVL